ncbi:MAG TPA: site-specific integrase [Bacteroidia bacterium]|nr:site-specific integrase [Bacteroidia bacterium]
MTINERKCRLTVRFHLKITKANHGEFPLYLRIIYKRIKVELSTGLLISPDEWNFKTGELRYKHQHTEVHQKLIALESQVYQISKHRELKGLKVSSSIIKQIIRNKMNIDTPIGHGSLLIAYLKSYIEFIKGINKEYTPGTVQHYVTLVGHLENFIKSLGLIDIPIHVVDTRFIQGFDDFLMTWINPKLGRAMNRNTANRNHSKLNPLLTRAVLEKLIHSNPYAGFKLKRAKPKSDYLVDHEIQLLINKRLDNNSLETVRLYLLMSIFMGGVRFSDLKNVKSYNIIEEDGFYFLHIHRQEKTDASVLTPLLPCAVEIFSKYQWCQDEEGYILPRLTQQKLNEYLKTLADLCGVQKRMTHKIARHTFATTICSQHGVPRHLIAAWLGHYSQIRTTDIYARVTKQESMIWVKKLWEIYNKPEYILK